MDQKLPLFIRILLPFCIGIAGSHGAWFAKLNLLTQYSALFIIIILVIFNKLYSIPKVYLYKEFFSYLLYIACILAGGLRQYACNTGQHSDHFCRRPADYLKICIADEPQQGATVLRFMANVTGSYRHGKRHPSDGKIRVAISLKRKEMNNFKYGGVYLIPATYVPVLPPQNPGEFDFSSWLAGQDTYHQIFLDSEELLPVKQAGSALISFTLSLRREQVAKYRSLIKSDAAFAVASTLILGYRADLDSQILQAYSMTGTIHALSVSGMHVGLIYVVLEWSLSWMNRRSALRWTRVLLILVLIWWYTLITGYSPSVLRSAIMLTCYILGKSFQRNTGGYHALALSAFLLLLWNPLLLWDAGFQLSYLSVFGLIYLYPKIYRQIDFKWTIFQKLWSMIAVSLAAQLITFPVSVYYFHQFPVYFLLSNLLISLPITLLMYGGILILLVNFTWLAQPFEWLITSMNEGLDSIAHLPYSTINQIWWTKTELLLLSVALCLTLAGFSWKVKELIWLSLALLLCTSGLLAKDEINCQQQRKIIQFTVRGKYCVAFITGKRAVLITNLLPGDRAFKFHIQPALDKYKVGRMICIPWGKRYKTMELALQGHQLYFGHFSILMADSTLNSKDIRDRPGFDVIWFHGLSKASIIKLSKQVLFKKIWKDDTKASYRSVLASPGRKEVD